MKSSRHDMLFKGMVFDIEQMEVEIGGRCHTFQVIRHPGGAGVLPVHDDGSVTLIRQLRPAVADHLVEIPAGRLDPGEPPAACAGRELQEETGITAEQLVSLGFQYSSPGVFDEVIDLYAALGLTAGEASPEADEEFELLRIPLAGALQMVADGRISDSKTVTALCRWDLKCRTHRA